MNETMRVLFNIENERKDFLFYVNETAKVFVIN